MNIIKFKDVIRIGDVLFNRYLKGKYAYFVHMRYAVPFDLISVGDYVAIENDIDILLKSDTPRWDMQKGDIAAYVDESKTDEANSIGEFVRSNKFTTDECVTLDEVKRFRTWLASNLLEFDLNNHGCPRYSLYTEQFTHVLEYYSKGMYDDVCKWLTEIKPATSIQDVQLGCGCNMKPTDIFPVVEHCRALNEYRSHIYALMVHEFSQVDFWTQFPAEFIVEFKCYIDNIITLKLPLKPNERSSAFVDCECFNDTAQLVHMETLSKLSTALGYLAQDLISGNRNFIRDAFHKWAAELYEAMEWQ